MGTVTRAAGVTADGEVDGGEVDERSDDASCPLAAGLESAVHAVDKHSRAVNTQGTPRRDTIRSSLAPRAKWRRYIGTSALLEAAIRGPPWSYDCEVFAERAHGAASGLSKRFVYVMLDGVGSFKIGISAVPEKRRRDVQRKRRQQLGQPVDVRLAASVLLDGLDGSHGRQGLIEHAEADVRSEFAANLVPARYTEPDWLRPVGALPGDDEWQGLLENAVKKVLPRHVRIASHRLPPTT